MKRGARKPPSEPAAKVWPGATPRQSAFLTAIVMYAGHRTKAAKAAKVARSMTYRWQEDDPRFGELFARAKRQAFGTLEDEMVRRAYSGVKKGVYYQGDICGMETVYSDGLMMMLARAGDPKYRSSEVAVEGSVGLKFEGPMEELLNLYRKLTSEKP